MNEKQILKKISLLKTRLDAISSMRSGSLSQQYNVCGSPGCKCKNSVSPEKHGPYFKLRANINGKSTTRFVKDENVEQVKKQLENHKKFLILIQEWVSLASDLADLEIVSKSEKVSQTKAKN